MASPARVPTRSWATCGGKSGGRQAAQMPHVHHTRRALVENNAAGYALWGEDEKVDDFRVAAPIASLVLEDDAWGFASSKMRGKLKFKVRAG